jgi:hypothetical protein
VGMKPGKEVDAANNLRSRVWPGVGWVNLSPLEDMDPGLPCAGGGRRGTARHGCCGLRRKPMAGTRDLESMRGGRSVVSKQGSYQPIKQFDLYALREMRIQNTSFPLSLILFTTFIRLFTIVKKQFIFNTPVYVSLPTVASLLLGCSARMRACVHV